MMRVVTFWLMSVMATGAAAGQVDPPAGERIEIDLSSFSFAPSTVILQHGRPYTLHLVNRAGGGHGFVAKTFFAAAHATTASGGPLRGGEVELAGGDSADVHLIAPAPGRYEAHCSHFMHSTFGMKATIVVE